MARLHVAGIGRTVGSAQPQIPGGVKRNPAGRGGGTLVLSRSRRRWASRQRLGSRRCDGKWPSRCRAIDWLLPAEGLRSAERGSKNVRARPREFWTRPQTAYLSMTEASNVVLDSARVVLDSWNAALLSREHGFGPLRHGEQRTVVQPRRHDLHSDAVGRRAAGAAGQRDAGHKGEVEQRGERARGRAGRLPGSRSLWDRPVRPADDTQAVVGVSG